MVDMTYETSEERMYIAACCPKRAGTGRSSCLHNEGETMEKYLLWQKIEEAHRLGRTEIMYFDGKERIEVKIPVPTPRSAELLYYR